MNGRWLLDIGDNRLKMDRLRTCKTCLYKKYRQGTVDKYPYCSLHEAPVDIDEGSFCSWQMEDE